MKVSVVTIGLNPGLALERTIQSIVNQTYRNSEWIVIDGASNDKSLEMYQRVTEKIYRLISGPDAGIADAMNKGLAVATGDAVIYMNAGDAFATAGAIDAIVQAWDPGTYQWATGDTLFCSEQGQLLYTRRDRVTRPEALVDRGCRIQHPSTIVLRKTLLKEGGFDTEFRIAMDYELWLRLISRRIYPQTLGFPVSKFYLGGTSRHLLNRYSEDRRARKLHGISNPVLETELAAIACVKHILAPLRHFRLAYLLKEWLRV
jgi:glycosyltransferase involved in cell wall biosynthesis